MTIGDYLLSRLRALGLQHVIGVPGDYNLQFLEQMIRFGGFSWVGVCNELNGAYAADGYGRLSGISALVVTHGVGSLSALNGIAGAYCERVPVICIAGTPPLSVLDKRLAVHHTLADGKYDNVLDCYRHFTVAQARLTPGNAAIEMDRVLTACWREKRPVYLELPSDISYLEIGTPQSTLNLEEPRSDPERLSALAKEMVLRFERAQRPMLLLDTDAHRFKLVPAIMALAEKVQAPIASLSGAKGVANESSPLFLGTYQGSWSKPQVREAVEDSDCLLCIGARFVDANTGIFTHNLPDSTMYLNPHSCSIGRSDYQAINAREVLEVVSERFTGRPKASFAHAVWSAQPAAADGNPDSKLTQEMLWQRVAEFLRPHDVVLSDIGTSIVGLAGITLPAETTFLAQPTWGSIGYALPALLGTLLAAPDRRHLLFVGDGSFQLTAQELSTILRLNLKPIIFLLNNGGYTIERAILGRTSSYNEVNAWRYAELPNVFDTLHEAASFVVRTQGELVSAMSCSADKLRFIELILDRYDAPKMTAELGGAYADLNFGPRGPQQEPGMRLKAGCTD